MRSFLLIGVAFGLFSAPGEAQLRVVVDRSAEAERAARDMIATYYHRGYDLIVRARESGLEVPRTIPMDREAAPRSGWPSSCVGTSLAECFGGDPDCPAIGFDRPSHSDGFKLCTAPELPALRAEILSDLDLLSTEAPGSDWIAGQRVGFALKNGDAARALASASTCGATPWWCLALRGLALHAAKPGSGGAAFDSAMANAPPGTAAWETPRIPDAGDRGLHCEWNDLSTLIVDEDLLAEFARLPCGENRAFAERFWWLADPLWSQAGNERRDEHMARNVQMRLRDQVLRAHNAEGRAVGPHHAQSRPPDNLGDANLRGAEIELGHRSIIPLGLPNSWRGIPWSRSGTGCLDPFQPPIVSCSGRPRESHSASGARVETTNGVVRCCSGQARQGFVNGGYSFVPDAGRFRDPMSSTAADWALPWNQGHERMVTRETWYHVGDEQTAVLRRGERLLALSALRLPILLSSLDGIDAALAMGRPADLRVESARASVDALGVIRASVSVPDGDWLASVEMSGDGWRGRARHGAPAPVLESGFGVSAPLLVTTATSRSFPADGNPPRDDEELLRVLLPTSRLGGVRSAGVYFEVYGVTASEVLNFSLHVEAVKVERSILGRLGRAIGFGSDPGVAKVTWSGSSVVDDQGVTRQAVDLVLPELTSGEYRVVIEVWRADGRTATASRDLRLY